MSGIFISYRREDTAGHAGRLFDRLVTHFGRDTVFMDVEGIEAGVDFVETIERAVGSCDVLLAVIGRNWLDCKDSEGRRRLDDPHDFIRLETGAALARNVRVIPILVEGAGMPSADALPEPLRLLTRRQAVELRDSRWEADVEALIAVLERVLAPGGVGETRAGVAVHATTHRLKGTEHPTRRPAAAWMAAGIAALVLGGVLAGLWFRPSPPKEVTVGNEVSEVPTVQESAPTGAVVAETGPPGSATQPSIKTPSDKPQPDRKVSAEKEADKSKPPAVRASAGAAIRVTPTPTEKKQTATPKATTLEPRAPVAIPVPVQGPTPDQTVASPPPEAPKVEPQIQPKPLPQVALVQPVPQAPPPKVVAVIAGGEPSWRNFWEKESAEAYSAKMAALFSDTLQDAVRVKITVNAKTGGTAAASILDGSTHDLVQACSSTSASVVFVAHAQDSFAISSVESAYWPELRLAAIVCGKDEKYQQRYNLSPRRGEGFPFAKDMAEAMVRFTRDHRHLLQ